MQSEMLHQPERVELGHPALKQVYGPQAVMSINKSGDARQAFSHMVDNADGSRDMIITLKLGSRSFRQVIHVKGANEQEEHYGHEEMVDLQN